MTQLRYLTKYALTSGVRLLEMRACGDSGMYNYSAGQYAHGPDSHATREAAIARVAEMRDKKIASLRKQIEKLQKIKAEALVIAAGEKQ